MSAERKIEVSAEQRLQMYVVNGSDGRCIVAVRLIVGVRYLERPLREVLLYIIDILIIIITFPYSTCINSFFGSIIPISLFIFKCFFVLVYVIFLQCYN